MLAPGDPRRRFTVPGAGPSAAADRLGRTLALGAVVLLAVTGVEANWVYWSHIARGSIPGPTLDTVQSVSWTLRWITAVLMAPAAGLIAWACFWRPRLLPRTLWGGVGVSVLFVGAETACFGWISITSYPLPWWKTAAFLLRRWPWVGAGLALSLGALWRLRSQEPRPR